MKDISILLAFSAGLLSFLSPCVLPMIPAYISYLTGTSIKELKEERPKLLTLYKAIGFILGFSIIFILMGASVTSLGRLLTTNKDMFRKVGGVLIVLFGVHTMGFVKFTFLYREKRFLKVEKIHGTLSSTLLGMAFAAGWTPCIGPILSSILIYATSTDSIGKGVMLLGMYSLGLAVPFLLTAMALGTISNYLKQISKYYHLISIISGILLITMGILVFTNKIAILSQYASFISF
ncbi:cytochrome c biogenesis CcdA family protein [Anaeromicropila herbilytica]|uniref:Cytochrome C biogenesis protein CcdA n=1 Tax=Anaeromicropila herbilytica TaxID=2785025 RepID=A0A7R7EIP1_9FIRM|nr:cytochrome c biogenesis protein CcdA [Anaeromicropila herbilytica]BCN29576.1 cytochrome C biogenesis protein CcdA [Anaeromicropila herbilytica]